MIEGDRGQAHSPVRPPTPRGSHRPEGRCLAGEGGRAEDRGPGAAARGWVLPAHTPVVSSARRRRGAPVAASGAWVKTHRGPRTGRELDTAVLRPKGSVSLPPPASPAEAHIWRRGGCHTG